jgi:hypothetical protein
VFAALDGAQSARAQILAALVEQHRVDPLHPGGVFPAQGVVELQQRSILQHLCRRDVALRQPLFGQQGADRLRVRPVGLGPPRATTPGRGVGRLGQVRGHPGALQLLDQVPPSGARLGRERDIVAAGEPVQPCRQPSPISRDDLTALHLAGDCVEMVEGDLLSGHIEPAY